MGNQNLSEGRGCQIQDMKVYFKRLFLIIAFAVFSLLLLFHFSHDSPEKLVSQNQIINKTASGSPMRLGIPSINVKAHIQHLSVSLTGEMEVPSNSVDVGWFYHGPRPGDKGSAVIAGHLNGLNGEAGVFANLHKIREGDKLYIEDDKGKSITFVVRRLLNYDPGYAEEVFSRNDGSYLNLVTCDGTWDENKKSYSKRLVVFADISP